MPKHLELSFLFLVLYACFLHDTVQYIRYWASRKEVFLSLHRRSAQKYIFLYGICIAISVKIAYKYFNVWEVTDVNIFVHLIFQ